MRKICTKSYWRNFCSILVLALTGLNSQSSVLAASGSGVIWHGPVIAGYSTTFNCSSSCVPQCTYTWSFKGQQFNGSQLTWTPDGRDSVVQLQCTIQNPKTGESFSHTIIVEINNRVSVQISPQDSLPSLNQSQSLVCQGAARCCSGLPVVWYKNGQKLSPRVGMSLQQYNTTLHFDSLLPSDAGFYQCEATVPTFQRSTVFSQGYLLSFDPWNVSISGPDAVFEGRESTFTCLTSCTLNVDCTVRWTFKSGFPIGFYFSVNRNVLKWTPSVPGTIQNFTCVAENKAAGRSAEATKMVEVVGSPLSGSEAMQHSGFSIILILGLFLLNY